MIIRMFVRDNDDTAAHNSSRTPRSRRFKADIFPPKSPWAFLDNLDQSAAEPVRDLEHLIDTNVMVNSVELTVAVLMQRQADPSTRRTPVICLDGDNSLQFDLIFPADQHAGL